MIRAQITCEEYSTAIKLPQDAICLDREGCIDLKLRSEP